MPFVYPSIRVQFHLGSEAFDWRAFDSSAFDTMTTAGADLLATGNVRVKYGIDGNGPTDGVASTGELQYVLRNDARNSALLQGYYSPAHTNVRSGWTFGIPVRAVFTYNGTDYIKFTGKIRNILPDAGRYRTQRVQVTAYDVMRELAEADAREVTIQTNKAEDELLNALIAAMPSTAQPLATDFDAGVDSYPYVFDKVAGDTKALAVARDIVVSSLGMLFCIGNGTLKYRSRHSLATTTSAVSLDDDDLDDLVVPSSLDGVYNRVRVTTHPKVISAAATDELYTLPTGSSIEVGAGVTVEVWTAYTDPNDRQTNVGGSAVVTALVGGTHYAANAAADGSGANMTASITATLTPFASTAKWSFTNAASTAAFITTQKVIGKAVRDPGPRTFEAYDVADYGDRPLVIDLPYQDDPYIGQSAADYLVAQYSALSQQIESVTFLANRSDALMVQALTREPGDRITLSETVTGVTSVQCIIQSVELELRPGPILICKWGVRPANTIRFWQWGIAGASEWGSTTIYAF